jgi:hypothetical protein
LPMIFMQRIEILISPITSAALYAEVAKPGQRRKVQVLIS